MMLPAPKFTKNTATITTSDSVMVVNHQSSRFGPDAFINIGVAYLALGLPTKVKEETCHLRFRADLVLSADECANISSWLTTKGAQTGTAVSKLLGFIAPLASIPSARALRQQQPRLFDNMLIMRDLRAVLDG